MTVMPSKGDILNIAQVPGAAFKHCKVLRVENGSTLTVRKALGVEVLLAHIAGWTRKMIRRIAAWLKS